MSRMTDVPAQGTLVIVIEVPASVSPDVSERIAEGIQKLTKDIGEIYRYSYVVSENRGRYVLVGSNEPDGMGNE